MNKKHVYIAVLVAIFAGLLLYVFLVENKKKSKEEEEEVKDQSEVHQVLEFDKDKAQEIAIEDVSGKMTFKKEGENWTLLEDPAFDVNNLKVQTLINTLSGLKATDKFESDNLSDFGLDKPQTKVYIRYEGGENAIEFGNKTIDAAEVYLKKNDDNSVYIVSLSTYIKFETDKDSFKKISNENGS
ncbi:DUF4340 domain-containing protein [Patescibacteria group bacterium]|nr:DUF4340 domain-containing protein [Patescibacteria group bacterium]